MWFRADAAQTVQYVERLPEVRDAVGAALLTLGDGNCLFRALADQYYGSPSKHLELRGEICAWIAGNGERYAPFVDDERGLDVHLECMRRPGELGCGWVFCGVFWVGFVWG